VSCCATPPHLSDCVNWPKGSYISHGLGSPASRISDEAQGEEDGGEGLQRAADGEDGAADAVPAADRLRGEGKKVVSPRVIGSKKNSFQNSGVYLQATSCSKAKKSVNGTHTYNVNCQNGQPSKRQFSN
jgi:hypothetical protein